MNVLALCYGSYLYLREFWCSPGLAGSDRPPTVSVTTEMLPVTASQTLADGPATATNQISVYMYQSCFR